MGKKKPSRDDYLLKERVKVESEVFDRPTLLVISKLLKKKIIETLDYPVSTGKEAIVFRGTTQDGKHVAVKIYKIETTHFFRKSEYLEGDPRFKKIKHTEKEIVSAFVRKEFKNLEICEKAKVHAPKPLFTDKNIIVMGFIGEKGLPYPTMDMVPPRSGKDFESVLGDMKKMYKAGLVHTDLSEFNLMLGKVPYLIDFGQGVVTRHPNAEKFLERDVRNILNYFKKFGYERDFQETLEWIKS